MYDFPFEMLKLCRPLCIHQKNAEVGGAAGSHTPSFSAKFFLYFGLLVK